MAEPETNRIAGLTRGLLERGYTSVAGRVLALVAGSVMEGVVQRRLEQIDAEAERLGEAGLPFDPDNPVMRVLIADLASRMADNAAAMVGLGPELQASGVTIAGQTVRQLALPGMDDAGLRTIGITWNRPDPEAVFALVGYVDSPEWADEVYRYGDQVADVVANQALMGMINGWHPSRTVEEIRQKIETFPLAHADNIMRTLQLTSFRTGTAVHQVANADILEHQIRVAVLDERTCLSCIALHGTQLPIGQRVNDHHRGRCSSITRVRGIPARQVESGTDWFNRQPRERKLTIAGPSKFRALESGRVQLDAFVQPYEDPVYGAMVREASLKGVLGEGAREFYGRQN